jgi:hypothetical protein
MQDSTVLSDGWTYADTCAPLTHVFNEFQRALACVMLELGDDKELRLDLGMPRVLQRLNDVCGTRVLLVKTLYGAWSQDLDSVFEAACMQWRIINPRPDRSLVYIRCGGTRRIDGVISGVIFVDGMFDWVYDPERNELRKAPMGHRDTALDAVIGTLPDGSVFNLILGRTWQLLVQLEGKWEERIAQPRMFMQYAAVVVLDNYSILVTGGQVADRNGPLDTIAACVRWDLDNNVIINKASMWQARHAHAAVKLPNGHVLVTGGDTDDSEDTTNTCEEYDPVADYWMEVPPMVIPRKGHTLVLLASLNVVVAVGGVALHRVYSGFVVPVACEMYDLASRRWSFGPCALDPGSEFIAAVFN